MWNKIRSLQGNKKPTNIYLSDGTNLTTDPKIVANDLAKYFEENTSNNNYNPEFLKNNQSITPPVSSINTNAEHQIYLNSPITLNEYYNALKSCKSKSPGPDDIPFIFIHNFPLNATLYLLEIFNLIWKNNSLPSSWRHSIIIPISKPGKNKFKPEGYRPISLLNTMGKLLEKIINHRLTWYLEKINFLSAHQYGFRKYRSTHHCLAKIHSEIQCAFEGKQSVGMICLDISKAYDCTWRPHIVQKLNHILSPGNLINYINNFLKTRTFQVRIGNTLSDELIQVNGVPQGSVISVTLFLIAINNLVDNILPPVQSTLYADDFNIFCRSKQVSTIQRYLQEALNHLTEWTKTSGFSFSPSKSQAITFTKTKKNSSLNVKLNGQQIVNCKIVKVLGVFFDQKTSWLPQINSLRSSTLSRLNIIKILSHTSWGSNSNTLIKIYKSLILSKLTYGSFLWINAKQSILKKIDSIHNTGLRMAIGAFRSSPVSSIHNLANIPPLIIHRKMTTSLLATRLARISSSLNNQQQITSLCKSTQNVNLPLAHIIKPETLDIPPWISNLNINTELTIHKKKCTDPKMYFHLLLQSSYQDESEQIYTDASKNENGVGISVIWNERKHIFKLSNLTSIYSAEAIAILHALHVIQENNIKKAIIFSDSLSVLKNLNNVYSPSDITTLILNLLYKLINKGFSIKIMWIPGHCNIAGNETADIAAKEAISSQSAETVNILPHSDLKSHIKSVYYQEWNSQWRSLNTKLNEIKNHTQKWIQPTGLSRKNQVLITRLRIGHTRLTHGFLMSKTEPPLCDVCGVRTTIKHILTECAKYQKQRTENEISEVLSETLGPQPIEINKLLNFLTQTDLSNNL